MVTKGYIVAEGGVVCRIKGQRRDNTVKVPRTQATGWVAVMSCALWDKLPRTNTEARQEWLKRCHDAVEYAQAELKRHTAILAQELARVDEYPVRDVR